MMTMLGPFVLAVEHSTRATKTAELLTFIVIGPTSHVMLQHGLLAQKARGV